MFKWFNNNKGVIFFYVIIIVFSLILVNKNKNEELNMINRQNMINHVS